MKPRTNKRSAQEREYRKLRESYLGNPRRLCEIGRANYPGCGHWATEIHHQKGRIGDLLTDTRYFLAVCHSCHVHTELNPKWAKLNGYTLNRFKKRETVLEQVKNGSNN